MNSGQVTERVLRLVTPHFEAVNLPSLRSAVLTNIPVALEIVARRVAGDKARRDMLRRTAPTGATVTTGKASLATVIATDKVLLDFIQSADIRLNPDTLGTSFHWLQYRGQLAMKRPTDAMFICCALDGTDLYTRSTDGLLDADLGAISISANYIPTLAQLPFALETEFLDTLANAALARAQNGKK